jgi:hypothetical protein
VIPVIAMTMWLNSESKNTDNFNHPMDNEGLVRSRWVQGILTKSRP